VKTLITVILAVNLVGCATPPQWLAHMYDSADPCQSQNNGGQYPSFCGASSGRVYVYDRAYSSGPAVGYIQQNTQPLRR